MLVDKYGGAVRPAQSATDLAMVNYKRVVLLAALAITARAAPAADCDTRHYDQRQNGTENYRLNIDGVVIAVAPADTLLAAASELDISDLLDLDNFDDFKPPKPDAPEKPLLEPKPQQPKPEENALESKPQDSKPQDLKPQDSKPEPAKPVESPLSDVSLDEGQKKDVSGNKKQEKNKKLKNRLVSLLMPLLRKTRHH